MVAGPPQIHRSKLSEVGNAQIQKVRRNHFPNGRRLRPMQGATSRKPQGRVPPPPKSNTTWDIATQLAVAGLALAEYNAGRRHQAAVYHHHFNPPTLPTLPTTHQPSLIRGSVSKDLMQGNWNHITFHNSICAERSEISKRLKREVAGWGVGSVGILRH